jgi:hypothetical protein
MVVLGIYMTATVSTTALLPLPYHSTVPASEFTASSVSFAQHNQTASSDSMFDSRVRIISEALVYLAMALPLSLFFKPVIPVFVERYSSLSMQVGEFFRKHRVCHLLYQRFCSGL